MNQKCIDFYCRMAIKQLELLKSRVDSNSLEEYIPENESDFAYTVAKMAYEDDLM